MTEDRRYRLILLAVALLLFSFRIAARDLWAPDEPRYAGIARSILETGDWLTLRDNALPYTQKPPLFFWILAAVARLGKGITELTSRLPSVLFAIFSVHLVYRLGRDLFGARVGLFGGLILATSQRFFLEARWVHIDMLLCFLVLAAMDSAYRALETKEVWRWVAAYGATALGCLAKGPVALALPAVALITFLASSRELSRLRETRWVWGVPAALLPTLLWLWASSGSVGRTPWEVIRIQVLQRFQEGIHHPRPFYYYFYSLPLEFLPWTPFLVGALAVTLPIPGRERRRPLLFLYGWALGGLTLLSLSAEKRPSYLLPLFPPLALLVAVLCDLYLTRWDPAPLRRWIQAPLALYSVICLGGVLLLAFGSPRQSGLTARLVPLGFWYAAACAAALTAFRLGRRGAVLVILFGGVMGGYLWIAGALLPWLNDYKSARPFCERVVSRVGSAPLGIYGAYHPAYSYYTHRTLEVLRKPEDLATLLSPPREGYCFLELGEFERVRGRIPLKEIDREAVGHRTFVLVAAGSDVPLGAAR